MKNYTNKAFESTKVHSPNGLVRQEQRIAGLEQSYLDAIANVRAEALKKFDHVSIEHQEAISAIHEVTSQQAREELAAYELREAIKLITT